MKEIYSHFRDARLIKVIKVEVNEGEGISSDPIRRVVYYIEPETGAVLAKVGDNIERMFAGGDQMYPVPNQITKGE